MPHGLEVFDNAHIHWRTRRKAARISAVMTTVVSLTLLTGALVLTRHVPLPVAGAALVGIWLAVFFWISNRLRNLRRIVWCIKLSEDRIVGYNYARRQTAFAWSHLQRVDLTDDGLFIVGPSVGFFRVPHLFSEFSELSHRVVHYAEQHDVPIFIDGEPWQDLDVYTLFPFLVDEPPAPGAATA